MGEAPSFDVFHNKIQKLFFTFYVTHTQKVCILTNTCQRRIFNEIACNSISISLVINLAQVALSILSRSFQGVPLLTVEKTNRYIEFRYIQLGRCSLPTKFRFVFLFSVLSEAYKTPTRRSKYKCTMTWPHNGCCT